MEKNLNEQFIRMQKIAGLIKENQVSEATGIGAVDYTVRILNKFKSSIPFDAPTILKKAESLKNYVESQYDTEEIGAEMAYTEVDDMIDAINNGDDIMSAIDTAIANLNLSENKESYYKDAEKDDADHIDALEKDMKDDAEYTSEGKMTKSELKAKIKEMILAELTEDSTEDQEITDDNADYDPVAEMNGPYNRNQNDTDDMENMNLDDFDYEDENYSDGYIDDYDSIYDQGIDEAKKDKEEEIEDITVDATTEELPDETLSSNDIPNIQSHLQSAYAEAKQLGDEKLITQIANTITYFTKAHVLDTSPVNESMFPMLKKILK